MVGIIGDIIGVVVVLAVLFGILSAVSGDEDAGNTIIVNSITAAIMYAIVLTMFGLDGGGESMFSYSIPFLAELGKYGNVLSYIKASPGSFALSFVELVTLTLVISFVSNTLNLKSSGIFMKMISRMIIVLAGIIVYGMVMEAIGDNVVMRWFVYAVESLITVGAIAYTPFMLVANITGWKRGDWLTIYIVNMLPKTALGKSISSAINTAAGLLVVLGCLETQYGSATNILKNGYVLLEMMGPIIVMCIGIYIMLKSVFKR